MEMKREKNITEYLNGEELSLFFDLLTDQEKSLVLDNHEVRRFQKNTDIYLEGEEPKYFMCLLSGEIKITKEGLNERRQIVRMVRPVGFFAYRAFFANERYITGARSLGDADVLMIPNIIMRTLLEQNNELVLKFLEIMSRELGFTNERSISLTQKHVPGRLAESILVLEQMYGVEEDGATLSIYMSREDLANFSNMTSANCIRTLSSFVAEKIVAMDGRKIKLLDRASLEQISRLG